MDISRRTRIRNLVSRLNRERRLQSRKIDILCNDFVASHKHFLKELQIMNLQTELYESLIGETDMEVMLDRLIDTIERLVKDTNTAVWLGRAFETHVFNEKELTNDQVDLIEACFNSDIAERIYNSRRCLDLQELFEMGLPESEMLAKFSAFAIPLQNLEQQGFIFLYRLHTRAMTRAEVDSVAILVPGFSKAVKSAAQPAVK